jgi:hypothetical protein
MVLLMVLLLPASNAAVARGDCMLTIAFEYALQVDAQTLRPLLTRHASCLLVGEDKCASVQ